MTLRLNKTRQEIRPTNAINTTQHNKYDHGRVTMPVNRFWKSTVLGLPLVLLLGAAAQAQSADPTRNITPVTDEMLRNPPASDWLMWRRTYDAWGYSPLEQVNKNNVKDLQVAWTWSM